MASSQMKQIINSEEAQTTPVKSIFAWSKALVKLGSAARRWSAGEDASPCELVNTEVYSTNMLLKFRYSTAPEDERPECCQAKLQPLTYENVQSKSKTVLPVRRHEKLAPLLPTAGSWGAQQRSTSPDDEEKVGRAARSILNKITSESFDSLFEQLVNCGIERPEHVSKLMSEVFDKATKQHNFIPMYADLCMQLEKDPHVAAVVKAAGQQHNFRRLLLNQCQGVFEQLLEPCAAEQALDGEAALSHKQEALGNIKLIGHLLVNGMLSSKLLVECAEGLIARRAECPTALESLAALMMVAAPTFDNTEWQYHEKLVACFDTMRKLTKDKKTVDKRSQFLLRDVLDMREAGWPTSTKNPAVIHTEQDNKEAPIEASAAASPEVAFDLKTFRRNLAAILNDLTSDRNISAAVGRVRMAKVPLECQAEQFTDLVTRIVEEKRGPPRRIAMAFAASLVAAEQSAFDREQCLIGIAHFFQDVYPDLCNEVPRLPAMIRSEFTPTFCSVFAKAEIDGCLPPGARF